MRISDWSSDVCSSDLQRAGSECGAGGVSPDGWARTDPASEQPRSLLPAALARRGAPFRHWGPSCEAKQGYGSKLSGRSAWYRPRTEEGAADAFRYGPSGQGRSTGGPAAQIGRASGRERVWQYV